MLLSSIILCVATAASIIDASPPTRCTPKEEYTVRTRQGLLQGCEMRARNYRPFAAFRGIRYAKAPVGSRRFQAPEPAENWEGIKAAFNDGPQCAQKNYLYADPKFEGEEDCLFLNVYSPKISSLNANVRSKIPVMVYIHGGGFFSGSGVSYIHGPEYILENDVVLVTLNYRLGVLGFLSTLDDNAPGNFGLKDQILALKWVQDNIEGFGGDPKSITIFGQSAGAASVHYHILNEKNKGLFHRAICQSGSALNLWATPKDSLFISRTQGQFVGCPHNDTAMLVDCLKKVKVEDLVESGDKFKFWNVDPLTVYVPSLEKRSAKNPEPAIEEHPAIKVKEGRFQKIPLVMGVMANEGIIRAAPITTQSVLRTQLNARWDDLGPQLMALSESVPQENVLQLWKSIQAFYMKHGSRIDPNNSENVQDFVNIYSDRSFIYGMYQTALKHSKSVPVYFYKNNYKGKFSFAPYFAATNETINHKFSMSHCDDLIYLFRAPDFFPDLTGTDIDFSRLLVNMWTKFATENKPFEKFWTPIDGSTASTNFRHLNMAGPMYRNGRLSINLSMSSNFLNDRMNFWKNLDVNENKR